MIDFLERRLLLQKVKKRLHTKRVYETIAAYSCRWKYAKDRRLGIRDTNIDFTENLRRSSYLSTEYPESRSSGSDRSSRVVDDFTTIPRKPDLFNDDEAASPLLEEDKMYIPNSPLHTYNGKGSREGGSVSNVPKFEVHDMGLIDTFELPFADPQRGKRKRDQNLSLIDLTLDEEGQK